MEGEKILKEITCKNGSYGVYTQRVVSRNARFNTLSLLYKLRTKRVFKYIIFTNN